MDPQGAPWGSHFFSDDISNYLISAPVVEADTGGTEDKPRPRKVPGDSIAEDVEGIPAGEVAIRLGSPVAVTYDAGNGLRVLIQQLLISSHILKGWKTSQVSAP